MIKSQIKTNVYSSKELVKKLGSQTAIARLCKSDQLIKIGRGYYCSQDINTAKATFLIIEKYFNNAVVSGASALFNYQMIDSMPDQIDLDVARESKYRLHTDIFSFHRTTKITKTVKQDFYGVELKTYPIERVVFEVLRLEKNIGELARSVIKKFVANHSLDRKKLETVSKVFGTKGAQLLNLIYLFDESTEIY